MTNSVNSPLFSDFTSNLKKHKVSFADAEGVFYDPIAIHSEDAYSENEERLVAVGMGSASQILVVVYTFRATDNPWYSRITLTIRNRARFDKDGIPIGVQTVKTEASMVPK